MTHTPFDTQMENPWKNRENIPYPSLTRLIPIALVYLLSALTPIFFGLEQTNMIVYFALCAGVIYAMRMPRLVISVLLASFIPVALLGSFSIGTVVLAIVAATGCGAILVTAMQQPWRAIVLPLAAWTIAYAVTRDPALASLTLIALPAALLLALATITGQRRTTAICYTVGGFLLSILAILGVYFVLTYGTIDRNTIITHFESQRDWIVELLVKYRDNALGLLAEEGMQGDELYAMMQTLMSRETLAYLVAMLYNILPALVIVACSILAYEAQSLLCATYCTMGMKSMLTPASVGFTLSTASAILYLVAFAFTAILPASSMALAVAQNFYLILTPGLFLIGLGAISFRFRATKGGSKVFLILLLVFVFLLNPTSLFTVLAFFGAITVIISAIGLRLIQKMQGQTPSEGVNFGDRMPHEENRQSESEEKDEAASDDSEEDDCNDAPTDKERGEDSDE